MTPRSPVERLDTLRWMADTYGHLAEVHRAIDAGGWPGYAVGAADADLHAAWRSVRRDLGTVGRRSDPVRRVGYAVTRAGFATQQVRDTLARPGSDRADVAVDARLAAEECEWAEETLRALLTHLETPDAAPAEHGRAVRKPRASVRLLGWCARVLPAGDRGLWVEVWRGELATLSRHGRARFTLATL